MPARCSSLLRQCPVMCECDDVIGLGYGLCLYERRQKNRDADLDDAEDLHVFLFEMTQDSSPVMEKFKKEDMILKKEDSPDLSSSRPSCSSAVA